MDCTVSEVARILEAWAPASLAEEGDNSGLQVGLSSRTVRSALICLDVNETVIRHAADIAADIIVSHHPFLYRPLTSVSDSTSAGRLAVMAIERGIAVYAAHTNLDRAAGGVNDALCDTVGIVGAVPATEGSIGRIGSTAADLPLDEFALSVKQALGAPAVRVTGRGDEPVCRVYVLSGSGRHEVSSAVAAKADCMLTGELGYHDGQIAMALGLCVVEAGHYHTEKPVLYRIERHLQSQFQRLQYTVRTTLYETSTCPFRYLA